MLQNLTRILKYHGIGGLFHRIGKRFSADDESSLSEAEYLKAHAPKPHDDYREEIGGFTSTPCISIVMPVCDPPLSFLKEAIESVYSQVYENWELCIADDASGSDEVRNLLSWWEKKDKRIKVVFRETRGHIAAASQSALELSTGDYIGLLDHDDLLPHHALFHVAKSLQGETEPDILYSDEAKIDESGEVFSPQTKPSWSPTYLRTFMYVGHLTVYRSELIRGVGGFSSEFNGSQDFDLLLRASERAKNVVHIPEILYYWRAHRGSVASGAHVKDYAIENGLKALKAGLKRARIDDKCTVSHGPYPGTYEYTSQEQFTLGIVRWNEESSDKEFVSKLKDVLEQEPPHILFLHSSIDDLHPGEISRLLALHLFPFVGMTAPLLISKEDNTVSACGWSKEDGEVTPNLKGHTLYEGGPGHRLYVAHEVEYLTLEASLISTGLLKEVMNGVDERVSVGSLENDMNERVSDLQKSLVVVPSVKVFKKS